MATQGLVQELALLALQRRGERISGTTVSIPYHCTSLLSFMHPFAAPTQQ